MGGQRAGPAYESPPSRQTHFPLGTFVPLGVHHLTGEGTALAVTGGVR